MKKFKKLTALLLAGAMTMLLLASCNGGGGGGKSDFAQGGGVDASKIDEALEALKHEAQKA